jgi:hypothetical protein
VNKTAWDMRGRNVSVNCIREVKIQGFACNAPTYVTPMFVQARVHTRYCGAQGYLQIIIWRPSKKVCLALLPRHSHVCTVRSPHSLLWRMGASSNYHLASIHHCRLSAPCHSYVCAGPNPTSPSLRTGVSSNLPLAPIQKCLRMRRWRRGSAMAKSRYACRRGCSVLITAQATLLVLLISHHPMQSSPLQPPHPQPSPYVGSLFHVNDLIFPVATPFWPAFFLVLLLPQQRAHTLALGVPSSTPLWQTRLLFPSTVRACAPEHAHTHSVRTPALRTYA